MSFLSTQKTAEGSTRGMRTGSAPQAVALIRLMEVPIAPQSGYRSSKDEIRCEGFPTMLMDVQ